MDRHEIEGYEVLDRDVRPVGNGAHVLVPKRWIGADVKVVRVSDPTPIQTSRLCATTTGTDSIHPTLYEKR